MEQYTQIFLKEDDVRIAPGETFAFDFDYAGEGDARLFFTGENDFPYFLKNEMGANPLYKRISDSLIPGTMDAFALKLHGERYPQAAMKKVTFPPVLYMYRVVDNTDEYTAGIYAAGRGVRVLPGGYLRVHLEIFDRKEGKLPSDTRAQPDRTVDYDLPQGDYPLTRVGGALRLPKETACVTFWVEGEDFEGDVVLERPYLTTSNGWNVLNPFGPDMAIFQEQVNWTGINLSKWEWPAAKIELNGVTVFDNRFFERCHRYSEKEFSLPAGVLRPGENRLSFTVKSDAHEPLAYRLHEVGIVSEPQELIAAVPETAVKGKEFALLLDVRKPGTLSVTGDVTVLSDLRVTEPGLCALRLRCDRLCRDLKITVNGETATVRKVIDREDDGVIAGTGDLIYIDQTEDDFRNFFKWYFSNRIGDLVTIRPTYRWSGTRKTPAGLWERTAKLLSDLGVRYSHMVDGREPEGFCTQPSKEELTGRGFLGRQLHERDGAYNYWGDALEPADWRDVNRHYDAQLITDCYWRMIRDDPDHAGMCAFSPENFHNDDHRYYLYHDPFVPDDMKARAEETVDAFRKIRKNCTRHTGPSIMFKYFHMAGYAHTGAETMDSPTEFLMAGLRGAADAYGQKTIGVHHAVQWSTTPAQDPLRYRRYRLALYVAWIQGSHENNTEEGLWHMEERYEHHHRHSIAAKEHLKNEQDFFRYIRTHARRGRLRARVAVMYGRYDGFACFGSGRVFGAPKDRFDPFFDAEQSWYLPHRTFYPNTVKGFHATAHGEKSRKGPLGLVSGTPYGNFNVVPVEEDYPDYPLIAYFSYNCAEKSDLDRLYRKVEAGATALMTLAHLTCTTDRKAIEAYQLEFAPHPFLDAVGFDYAQKRIPGAGDVAEVRIGKGRAVVFNTLLYPANPQIKDAYVRRLIEETEKINQNETVFPIVDHTVHAAVYETEDGCGDVYFLPVDWWNETDAPRTARLRLGEHVYDLSLPFGVLQKVSFCGDRALVCLRESGEILSFDGFRAAVQGDGDEPFLLLKDGKTAPLTVSFGDEVQKTVLL